MYLSHFGLDEAPFRITPHTEFFFSGANRGATLDALLYAISHDEGIVKVTGEVGSGKTMLCRVLVERLPKTVETIYLANPSLSRDEILHVIAADMQVEFQGERLTILLRSLQERLIKLYASGRRVVVLIDEAHAMPIETLEEVRLLSNLESNRHKLLQIVLFGQPELDVHLALPNMRQLKERITHSFKLEPLVRSDVESYIDFRMRAAGYRGPSVFASRATKLIARASLGLTRRINILADKSLLAAFAEGTHQVTTKHARAAIRDSEYRMPRWIPDKWWLTAGGVAAGLAAGIGFHVLKTERPAKSEFAPTPAVSAAQASAGASGTAPADVLNSHASSPVASSAEGVPSPAPATATESRRADGSQANFASVVSPSIASPQPRSVPTASVEGRPPIPRKSMEESATSRSLSAEGVGTPTPPTGGTLAEDRFNATQLWLKSAPAGSYTIQLLTVRTEESEAIERFLEQARKLVPIEDVYVYSVKQDGRQYYAVTYGNYPNLEDTITAMGSLPSSFKSRGPFHRSIALMRRQNQE